MLHSFDIVKVNINQNRSLMKTEGLMLVASALVQGYNS